MSKEVRREIDLKFASTRNSAFNLIYCIHDDEKLIQSSCAVIKVYECKSKTLSRLHQKKCEKSDEKSIFACKQTLLLKTWNEKTRNIN